MHLSYLLYVPASYATTPETRWPLILYLHGGSLRGDDVSDYAFGDYRTNWKASRIFRLLLSRRSVLPARLDGCGGH